MKRWISLMVVMFLSLLGSSCFCPLTSVNPLSDPLRPVYDERIEGAWRLMPESEGLVFLHFGKGKRNKTAMIFIEHKKNGGIEVLTFSVFPTLIDDQNYLNFNAKELFKEFSEDLEGYTFMKYRLHNGDTLTLFQLDEKSIVEAIKSGILQGDITYKKTDSGQDEKRKTLPEGGDKHIKCVKITASSKNLLEFLRSNDAEGVFKDPVVFKQINHAVGR